MHATEADDISQEKDKKQQQDKKQKVSIIKKSCGASSSSHPNRNCMEDLHVFESCLALFFVT